jgi:SAM-dependent methyltransferase
VELERFEPDSISRGQLHAEHFSRYEFAARFASGKRIVDIACGAGYGAALLKCHGAEVVIGIDRSEETIARAKGAYAMGGVTFLQGEISMLLTVGPADCIVSFETIEHIEHPETLLAASRDALVPDGLFIVSTPVRLRGTLQDRPENRYHVREWREAEFDRLLSGYFSDRKFSYQYIYRRHFYPLSRTIGRVVMNSFYGERAAAFARFPVVDRAWTLPGWLIERGFMIAVCSGRPSTAGKSKTSTLHEPVSGTAPQVASPFGADA